MSHSHAPTSERQAAVQQPSPESVLRIDPLLTLKYLLVCAAMIPAGYALVRAQMVLLVVIGAGLLFCGGLGVIILLLGGMTSGPCPLCGAKLEVPWLGGDNLPCPGCEEYLEASKRRLRQISAARVTDTPSFKARLPWWPDLGPPHPGTLTIGGAQDYVQGVLEEALLVKRLAAREVEAVWPAHCCVCGGPPSRCESLAREVYVPHAGAIGIRDRKLVVSVRGIPHCEKHQHGVVMSGSVGECGRVLIFRSYWYRNAFRRANPWEIGWKAM